MNKKEIFSAALSVWGPNKTLCTSIVATTMFMLSLAICAIALPNDNAKENK